MAKTAQEKEPIWRGKIYIVDNCNNDITSQVMARFHELAAREAAQEVEAYKDRLKAYLKDYYSGTEIDLSHIIDAVK